MVINQPVSVSCPSQPPVYCLVYRRQLPSVHRTGHCLHQPNQMQTSTSQTQCQIPVRQYHHHQGTHLIKTHINTIYSHTKAQKYIRVTQDDVFCTQLLDKGRFWESGSLLCYAGEKYSGIMPGYARIAGVNINRFHSNARNDCNFLASVARPPNLRISSHT